jgi:hypothetical protein
VREEILAAKPGKELDAFVNELIFGECRHVWERHGPNNWNHRCTKCGKYDGKFVNQGLSLCGDDEKRSTDISAAFEVFLKVDHNKERSSVYHGPVDNWVCAFDHKRSPDCKSAPEAICKAALLAVLEDKP